MRHIAKLFMNGRSQAVRLPSAFRFDCKEVFIRKDPVSGDIVLSRKPESWNDFFELHSKIYAQDQLLKRPHDYNHHRLGY